jgi:ribosome-associated heat shock protein Hsp15
MRHADRFGLPPVDPEIQFSAVMKRVKAIIAHIAPADSVERYTTLGVDVRTGHATLIDPWTVEVNGERPKRGKAVKVGDLIRVGLGPYEHHVVVRALSARRGPAAQAQLLYEETEASLQARTLLAERLRAAPPPLFTEKGRPTKKERRELDRWLEGDTGDAPIPDWDALDNEPD